MATSVNTGLTRQYVDPADIINDVEMRSKVFKQYNEKRFPEFLYQSGRKKVTGNTKFQWGELGTLYSTVTVDSIAGSAGNGNNATITIATADHQESGKYSPGRIGDVVIIGERRGVVVDKDTSTANAHTITVDPYDDTDIAGNVTASDVVRFYTHAQPDGDTMPESISRKPDIEYNYTQIVPSLYEAYGSASKNRSNFKFRGKPYFMYQGAEDAYDRFNADVEFALVMGKRGIVGDRYLTGGMDWFIRTFGHTENYTSGSWSKQQLQNIGKVMSKYAITDSIMLGVGIDLDYEIDDVMWNQINQSGVDITKMGVAKDKAQYLDFGIDGVRYGNFTYKKMRLSCLDYPPVTNHDSSSRWPKMGYAIPMMQVQDEYDGESKDSFLLRYKQNDMEDTLAHHWRRDETVTNKNALEFNYRGELGFEFPAASVSACFEPS